MEKKWKVHTVRWRTRKSGSKQPYQGRFYPGSAEKYEGNKDNIIFRSGLELTLFKYLDEQPSVIRWGSEEFVIRYVSPKDGRVHRYFLDAKITTRDRNDVERTYLIEVKPSYQCVPPKKPKKITRKSEIRFLRESLTYRINSAKWKAAEDFCKTKEWTFLKLTEKTLTFGRTA